MARKPVLLKATFLGHLPYQQRLTIPESGDLNVPPVTLIPISKELYEVVVKAAKAPLSIRGDTLEYDASKFKVPPGATLEDLLRKLPGVQVDKDGNVVAPRRAGAKSDGRRPPLLWGKYKNGYSKSACGSGEQSAGFRR